MRFGQPGAQLGEEQNAKQQHRRDKRDVHGWVVLDKPIGTCSKGQKQRVGVILDIQPVAHVAAVAIDGVVAQAAVPILDNDTAETLAATTMTGDRLSPVTKFLRSSGIDVKFTKLAKISAPIRMAYCWRRGVAPTSKPVFSACEVVPPLDDATHTTAAIRNVSATASKSQNNPFYGWPLKGKATMTIVAGAIVWQE